MARKNYDKTYVFSEMPVGRAVAYLVVPTVLTQIISILYNLADTYFIGQLGDPALVAALGICLPPMLLLTAFANLFGVGASSVISRALGANDEERARRAAAFSLWVGLAVAITYIAAASVFMEPFVRAIGATNVTIAPVASYLTWAFTVGGAFFFEASLLSHLLRSMGKSVQESVGVATGSIANIVLDPILIFGAGMGITGAAAATLAGQVVSVAILVWHVTRNADCDVIRQRPSASMLDADIARNVVTIGFVSFCMTTLAQVSNTCVNVLVSPHGAAYLAASSVAIKLNIAAFAIAIGLSTGVLPIIGFNYSAGNANRVKAALRVAVTFSLCMSACFTILVFAFPDQITAFFIGDHATIDCGRHYLREVALCFIPSGLVFITTSYLQAIGQKRRPYILAFTRMGTVDVICMTACSALLGPSGILLGKPIADWLCLGTACLVLNDLRRHQNPFAREEA